MSIVTITPNEYAEPIVDIAPDQLPEGTYSDVIEQLITGNDISLGSIRGSSIAPKTITSSQIAADAITAAEIAAGSITADKIAANAVEADKIKANAVVAGKISTGAVGASNTDTTIISGGKIITSLLTATNIQTGILTGITIRTASSGARVQLDSTNYVQCYDASYLRVKLDTSKLYFYDSSGVLGSTIEGDSGIQSGIKITGDFLGLYAGAGNTMPIYLSAEAGSHLGVIVVDTSGYLHIQGDATAQEVQIFGHLDPETNDTFDFGASNLNWRSIYVSDSASYGIWFGTSQMLYMNGGDLTTGADLDVTGNVDISGQYIYLQNNNIKADGTHITFDGSTNAHLAMDATYIGSANIGTATNYWNEINHKTLNDRGCLGCFDDGVELQDGTIVADTAALHAIQTHSSLETNYGVPRLDYSTMPKAVYTPVPIAKEDVIEQDREGKDYIRFKKGEKIGEDGANVSALISILLGAIKELDNRLKIIEGP